MRRMSFVPAFLLLAAIAAAPLGAQGPSALDLRVTDSLAQAPLPRAQVGLAGAHVNRVTDATGHALISGLPAGPQYVQVRRVGYRTSSFTLTLPPGATVGVDLELAPMPLRLSGVTAVGARASRALREAGFYDRQQAGLGQVITREELDRQKGKPLHDVFRGMRGVTVARGSPKNGEPDWMLVSSRSHGVNGEHPCPFDTYLDGIWQSDIDADHLDVQDLEGIEVFTDISRIPAQYNRTGSACGVILMWSKTTA
ncbi:MAG: TonB-dependent receptor plug [Gemmatimonadetes bacterium]|nr:TonB-dependent receptor plug [Gemmatimonadota bacterium]